MGSIKQLLLVATTALLLTAVCLGQQRYSVTDLGTLGGDTSVPFGINNSSQVVGYSFVDGTGSSTRRAFRYSGGVMQSLGTLGGPTSEAMGISENGYIVGATSITPGNDNPFAFLFSSNSMSNLGVLPSDQLSYAFSVNSKGQVVGLSIHDTDPNPFVFVPFYRGFLYANGNMQDLSALLGGVTSRANQINEAGQVVGTFNFAPFFCGQSRAFLYSGGTMFDLGTLSGAACGQGIAVNDLGEVVGFASAADGTAPRLFYSNGGQLQDLGSLGPTGTGRPWAINNAGQIVGSFSIDGHNSYAFIRSNGALQNLNDLVPDSFDWDLRTATDINDLGQITCIGFRPGTASPSHAFLLTPTVPGLVTVPSSTDALAFDSVSMVRDSFSLTAPHSFAADRRTRVLLLARELVFNPQQPTDALSVKAEDSQHRTFSLPIEHVARVPEFAWLTQIIVRLPDELNGAGNVQVSVVFNGAESNKAVIRIN